MKYLGWIFLILASCATTGPLKTSDAVPLAVRQSTSERAGYEASGRKFVVATQGVKATAAARRVIENGGNIIDAAVAASFVISVERPQSTGLGGGGFLLYREAKSGKIFAVDFRERAPLRATEKMFLDAKDQVIPGKSQNGILSVGVPGLVAGLMEIHERFGSLPREKLVHPSIELAENGFQVYPALAAALKDRREILASFPASAAVFLKKDGSPLKEGDLLIQKDLAGTLRAIAKNGRDGFYRGPVARKMLRASEKEKGLLGARDFETYKVRWREPVRGTYRGHEVVSMPPPSSGGTHVIEILNILENDDLRSLGFGSADAIHLEASAMQQAFADRARYMGDPDFSPDIPLKGLLSKDYAASIRRGIDPKRAKSADQVQAGDAPAYESSETTNFVMMDDQGNVVVSTQTINGWMGSGLVAAGTGVLFNNEMDDFSAKPGASNLFGAIGGTPNAIAPRKTPLSSMAPTIVLRDGKPVLALGAPGGTRIITCVAQTMLNYLDFKLPLYESVTALRLHQQWKPDRLDLETPGFGDAVQKRLEERGHRPQLANIPCRVNAAARENDRLLGVADPRDLGSSWAN